MPITYYSLQIRKLGVSCSYRDPYLHIANFFGPLVSLPKDGLSVALSTFSLRPRQAVESVAGTGLKLTSPYLALLLKLQHF